MLEEHKTVEIEQILSKQDSVAGSREWPTF